ncbi:MAG: hypothetical protein GXP14_09235 [Gammaproteobacteria bacterium]|nr:hypothetical protein [Gammaproteobacteria bacterium]
MLIAKKEIEKLIPHGVEMCLLDGVVAWNECTLTAVSHFHFSPGNPLLEKGQLAIVNLVEYGAQAAAIHAALNQTGLSSTRPAYLGAIKSIKFHCQTIDTAIKLLEIKVHCLASSPDGAVYTITTEGGDQPLLSGKIILVTPSS